MTETKRPRKRELMDMLGRGTSTIENIYNQLTNHIPYSVTEQDVFELLIYDEDKEMCRRGKELFDYGGHVDYDLFKIRDYADGRTLCMWFSNLQTFVPPNYLVGKKPSRCDINPQFLEKLDIWGMQLVELHKAMKAAQRAWDGLRTLTNDNVSQMVALWPTTAAISKRFGLSLDLLPKTNILPSPRPELRELMQQGADFINTALLVDTDVDQAKEPIRMWLA